MWIIFKFSKITKNINIALFYPTILFGLTEMIVFYFNATRTLQLNWNFIHK